MAFGPDGGLYVGFAAFGPTAATGAIVRLDLDQGLLMTVSDDLLASSTCPGAVATSVPPPTASPTTSPSDSPTATTGTPTPGGGGLHAVTIANFAFDPPTLSVAAGTTVTWTNNDTSPHTVTADDGSFDSGNLNPGQSFTFTFAQGGTFAYHCNYHPNMKASIVVQ
jgi:plastocyanin